MAFNYWKRYEGKAKFLILNETDLNKLIKNETDLIGFNYGDGLMKTDREHYRNETVFLPENLEQVSLMLDRVSIFCRDDDLMNLKILLCDAYEIQSRESTARKKGAILHSFSSTFKILSRKYNWTMIFVSSNECPILSRQIG